MKLKTIFSVILALVYISAQATDHLTLRLNPIFYDDNSESIYVSVDLRYDGYEKFYLADQNYRIYYDSKILSLNRKKSRSDLPQDLYSRITFNEILENLKAGYINDLSFDEQLGFVNFNIDLNDVNKGGIQIKKKDDWQRVAILNFKVRDKAALSNIVWSKTGKTDSYATAFVEIMEWIGPNHTEHAPVEEYIDAEFSVAESVRNLNVQISPNPALDYINLDFELPLKENVSALITDVLGRKITTTSIHRGTSELRIDVAELSPGVYNVEIFEEGLVVSTLRTSFVKVRE